MKVLMFAGSLRKDSLNKKLLKVAKRMLEKNTDVEASLIDLQDYLLPVYDGDIESRGLPEGVQKIAAMIREVDALIISSPEYNGSISGPLKNTIDWISRTRPMPLEKKHVLLMGASPSGLGAARGLLHSRAPFEKLENFVYPDFFALARAHEAFNEEGDLKDETQHERAQKLITAFVVHCQKGM